ncbi:MAG: hypothetical protein AAFQ94_02830 [Bacteroidota bacterium]
MKIPKKAAKSLKGDAREGLRQMNDRINRGQNYEGLNFKLYKNEGGHGSERLPPAGKGLEYYEGRSGSTRSGAPGRYRYVFLVHGDIGENAKVVKRYYTEDHYQNFYELT